MSEKEPKAGGSEGMKRETLLTAVVFLGVGFLAGYVYSARRVPSSKPAPRVPAASAQAETNAPGDLASELPKGHPPLNSAEVIRFFKDAAARNPADAGPRVKLANFFYDQHRYAEAIPWYEQALARDSNNVDARTDLATCYFNVGQTNHALAELHEALRIDPHHEATLFNLTVVNLEGTHNLQAAWKAWKSLYAINPGYPELERLKTLLNQAGAASEQPTAR